MPSTEEGGWVGGIAQRLFQRLHIVVRHARRGSKVLIKGHVIHARHLKIETMCNVWVKIKVKIQCYSIHYEPLDSSTGATGPKFSQSALTLPIQGTMYCMTMNAITNGSGRSYTRWAKISLSLKYATRQTTLVFQVIFIEYIDDVLIWLFESLKLSSAQIRLRLGQKRHFFR